MEAVRHEMDIVSPDQIPPVSFEAGGFGAQPAMVPMMMRGAGGPEVQALPYHGMGLIPYGMGPPYGASAGLYSSFVTRFVTGLACWLVVFLDVLT